MNGLAVDIEQPFGAFRLKAAFSSAAPVVALFGPSGAGKTSIVNAIAGIAKPVRGTITFNDTIFFDSTAGIFLPPEKRHIGCVFQDGLLFPHLRVEQNLFYGKPRDLPHQTSAFIDERKVIALLGLENLLTRMPATLSGGERQRVAIGRALFTQPRLLLLDEPLASLDNQRKVEILQYIARLRDEFHIPIVLVSHAVEEVVHLADTVVLLDDGTVKATGNVTDILNRGDLIPALEQYEAATVVDAQVIGPIADGSLTRLGFRGGELAVPSVNTPPGTPIRVRIRARDVVLATHEPQFISINNILPGTLLAISGEPGPLADVRIAVGDIVLIARITRASIGRLALHPGQTVYALVKAVSFDR